MIDVGSIAEMSSLQITDPFHSEFSAASFKRHSLHQRRTLALSISILFWGQKSGTLPMLRVPYGIFYKTLATLKVFII